MGIAIINGTVNRTFWNGKGVSVKESFRKGDGSEGAQYYTAFFEEDPGLFEGQSGKFSGLISARVNEYEKDGETRRSADIILNNTRFEPGEGSAVEEDDTTPF